MSRRTLVARVAAVLAVTVGIAIAVPVVLAVRATRENRIERLDARVDAAARDALAVLSPDPEVESGIDVDTYAATPLAVGAPETAVLDRRGRFVAGDRELAPAVRRVALARLRAERTGPVTTAGPDGDVRVVVRPVEGEDRRLGAVVAQASTREVEEADRRDLLLAGLGGAGGWLLLVGAGTLAVTRVLGNAAGAAEREQAFLADAGHELRTPWAVVAARAEEGRREVPADSPAARHLGAIEATARRAAAAIGDMLELARLDAGRAVTATAPVRLDALVETVVDERRARALQDGVALAVSAERAVVAADAGLLARAVGNLVDNAVRHGGAGGAVEVAVRVAGARARVEVTDHGPGVPPAQRERVFDRFHRAAGTAGGGVGLGLPIARLVARAHGGELSLTPSVAGTAGARFVLELPIASG